MEYMEKMVHPQNGYSRPGWLRNENYGAGMITGWGQHHYDSAAWGMDTEHTGPISVVVAEETHKMWNEVEDKSRVVWSCGGGMPQDVSTENIQAFINTIKDLAK
jgi:hypothetical protein